MNEREKLKDEPRLKQIITEKFNVNLDRNKSRKRRVVLARMIYTTIMRDNGHTWREIGESIGRDHSTVMYQYDTFKNWSKMDNNLRAMLIETLSYFRESSPIEALELRVTRLEIQIKSLTLALSQRE
jgi:chromosomal replication initiation ATPase DnaA